MHERRWDDRVWPAHGRKRLGGVSLQYHDRISGPWRYDPQRLHGGWDGSGRDREYVFPGGLVGQQRRRLSGPFGFRKRHTASLGHADVGPVTISPDGSAITASGPDAYPVDQIWYGTWQIFLPSPLKTAPIPTATQSFTTDYQTTLTEPAGTLTQYAEFNTGVSASSSKGRTMPPHSC